ncbi:ABC transporter ATP-binding protein/permease [Ectobacillus funiculus]|uniref:ABC transporter ATP-binding protein n=1 Tax=Ectobacillus funiculus TaxID=137993 RepID=UPI00397E189D
MEFFKKYKKKYGKMFSLALVFLTFEALCDLMQPTIMARIIDVGVANRDLGYVLRQGGLMLLITLFGALSASTRNVISSSVSQNFGTELRSDLFRRIQGLSFTNVNRFDRASLVTRLTNDVTQVQVFVNGLMRIFVKAPLLCIGGLIMATRLNPSLAIVLVVVVPIVALLIALNLKLGFSFFTRVQHALDRVNRAMREYLSGVRVVKAFHRFDYEVNKFEEVNEELQAASVSAGRLMAGFSPGVMLVVNVGIVAVLWFGGMQVSRGETQAGEVLAFTNYMTQIAFSLMLISLVFNMFVRAKASISRISEVFTQDDAMKWSEGTLSPSARGRIDFEHVFFAYEGTATVLHDITFTCMPGEMVGIIGSTGSGKSSLVGMIPRFYDADAGAVRVSGVDVRELNPQKLRETIAIVPQKTMLFTGTVLENIRWGKENATMEEIERAAKAAQAHDFITASPEGYETRIGQGGVNFSGGQKQRLSIARALVKEPDILILDDSTSALDAATEMYMRESLRKYANGLTCLIITQRISSVMDADKIIVLDEGRIAGIGTHDELLASSVVYQEIFRSQTGKEEEQYGTAR